MKRATYFILVLGLVVGAAIPAGAGSSTARAELPSPLTPAETQLLEAAFPINAATSVILRSLWDNPQTHDLLVARAKAAQRRLVGQEYRDVYLIPSPDLTGDRIADVIEEEDIYDDATARSIVRVRDGRNGKVTLNYEIPVGWAWATPMKLGAKGEMGVLVSIWDFASAGQAAAANMRLVALDRTGQTLWAHTFPWSYAFASAPVAYAASYQDLPVLFEPMQGMAGAAEEIVVNSLSYRFATPGVGQTHTTARVIDGATGAITIPLPPIVSRSHYGFTTPVGDLDGDKLDDLVSTSKLVPPGSASGATGEVQGRALAATALGTVLWDKADLQFGYWSSAIGIPDVTGNKTPDVIIDDRQSGNSPSIDVLDGASGKGMWSAFGGRPLVTDVDGKGKRDVIVRQFQARFADVIDHWSPITWVSAKTGSGKKLYDREISGPNSGKEKWRVWSWTRDGSDFNRDGVDDWIALQEIWDPDYKYIRNADFAVDGRTGKVLLRSAKMIDVDEGLDGKGSDVVTMTWKGKNLMLKGLAGTSKRVLWSTSLKFASKPSLKWIYQDEYAYEMTGDRCGDVVFHIDAEKGSYRFGVDGGSGKLLWKAIDDGGKVTQGKTKDRNRAC